VITLLILLISPMLRRLGPQGMELVPLLTTFEAGISFGQLNAFETRFETIEPRARDAKLAT
jgi:hypothetical protein